MKDVDRSKLYNSSKEVAKEQPGDQSTDEKELLMLEARLEKATGEDQTRIQNQIDEIRKKMTRERGGEFGSA